MPPADYFIGLMSGTSLDSIDAVLVSFDEGTPTLHARQSTPLPDAVRQQTLQLNTPGPDEIEQLADLDPELGRLFASASLALLEAQQLKPAQVRAIGSHGQTLRHRPAKGYSLQIGDPNIIAELTGITTVADFRRRDLAAGGQGAPLVPAFHQECFHSSAHDRILVNIGGMANITLLPADTAKTVIGYDTGPGNVLIDTWIQQQRDLPYDKGGAWAASGKVIDSLLNHWLSEPFFSAPYPKSTGRELFNADWFLRHIQTQIRPEDIQATLTELTARSIALAIQQHDLKTPEVYLCGGGSHNTLLKQRLEHHLGFSIQSTAVLGLDPDWVEACAFAWLAYRTVNHQSGNLAAVTGARGERILGGIYLA